tara:strand:- start:2648 stop:4024 length:1377 start_codon:yes stop_codon:yes gene_type:complete
MSRARDLSRFANNQAISIDSSLNVGINSTSPDATLDVVGIVSATEFFGDGSNLTGVSSPGLGTALSDDTTSPLNSIYFTNANLSVASTITVNPPSSASAAFTQYANIVLQNDADLIVADGDTFIPDILGIGTDVDEPGTLTGGAGKLRVDNITNKAGTGSPNFPFGMNVTGVMTATSFNGNGVNITGVITATGGVQVATGATISGSTNTITALTNGSERLRIASSGLVGIGTDNPSTGLHLLGADSYFTMQSSSASGNAGILFKDSSGTQNSVIFYDFDDDFLKFSTNNDTERLRIDSSGRLMLGTTTEGEANADDFTIATSAHTGMTIRSGTANRGNIYFSDGTSGDSEYRGYITYDHDGDKFNFGTGNSNRLTITSAGNVNNLGNVGVQTSYPTSSTLVGAASSLIGLYIGDGHLLFSDNLSRSGGYYIPNGLNALNAGPVTLGSTMTLDGVWVIV